MIGFLLTLLFAAVGLVVLIKELRNYKDHFEDFED